MAILKQNSYRNPHTNSKLTSITQSLRLSQLITLIVLSIVVLFGNDSPAAQSLAGTADEISVLTPNLPSSCRLQYSQTQLARHLTDSENFVLENGEELRLGVFTASLNDPAAKATLNELVTGRAVTIYPSQTTVEETQPSQTQDRYGRIVANATVRIGSNDVWIQGILIAKGLALTTFTNSIECGHKQLLKLEDAARVRNAGHWATGVFSVLDASDEKSIASHMGQFAVIEGRPRRRSQSRKGIYFNFGRNWKSDVTVFVPNRILNPSAGSNKLRPDRTISTSPEPISSAGEKSLSVLQRNRFSKKKFRTRGWLEERAGPFIEVQKLDQIEWLP